MHYQPNSSHGPHGYIMTSVDSLHRLSREGLLTDKKDIIKFRESILAGRHNVRVSKSVQEVTFIPKADSVDGFTNENVQTDEENERTESVPNTVKRKMKSIFKHMFKNKTSRNENNGEEAEVNERPKDDVDNDLKTISEEKHVEFVQEDNNLPEDTKKQESSERISHKEEIPASTGQSMVQMSVSLNLGQSAKTRYELIHVADELQCLEVYFDDSFIGGSCLKINPSDKVSTEHRLIRLLHCDFFCEDLLVVCVVVKSLLDAECQFLNLKCCMKDANNTNCVVNLIGRSLPSHGPQQEEASHTVNVYPIVHTSDEFKKLQKYLLLNEPDFYVPVENPYNWIVR
jgi:hypothetical protein